MNAYVRVAVNNECEAAGVALGPKQTSKPDVQRKRTKNKNVDEM